MALLNNVIVETYNPTTHVSTFPHHLALAFNDKESMDASYFFTIYQMKVKYNRKIIHQ